MAKRILFTGGGGVGNELIWRLLKGKYELFFCDHNIKKINPIIPQKNIIKVPRVKEKNYLNKIKSICKKKLIDILVPGIDEELILLKKNENNLPELYLPSLKTIKVCNDKWKFYQYCLLNNINSPKTSLAEDYKSNLHSSKVILKPRFGRGSEGIILSKSPLLTMLQIKILKNKNLLKKYIIQDFVKGDEFTVTHFKINNFSNLFPLLVKEKKGITNRAVYSQNEIMINFCNNIAKNFDYDKIFNIQLIKKLKKCYIIEINPRISTTFCMLLINKIDPFINSKSKKIKIKKRTLERYVTNFT